MQEKYIQKPNENEEEISVDIEENSSNDDGCS